MIPLAAAAAARIRVPSQPSIVIRSSVRLPARVPLEQVDDWLAAGFEVKVEPMPEMPADSDGQAAGLLWRGLLMAREFLQLAKVPAYDPPAILELRRKPETPEAWQTTVALPRVEQILNNAYLLAFNAGLDTVVQTGQLPRTPENLGRVYTAITSRVLEPLRRLVVAGESGMHVLRVAHGLGIPRCHLGGDVYQLGWGCHGRITDRSSLAGDSAMGAQVVRYKHLAAAFLRQAGLPTPDHEVVINIDSARKAAARIGYPVVVKPTDRERGEGVTTDVRSEAALAQALTVALSATPSKQALVERQVAGVCHRLFMVRGHLLYAVKRLPLSIEGNGRSTVTELVAQANAREAARPPWRRAKPLPLDQLALQTLAACGKGPQAVPAAGQWLPLRPIETTAWGGHDEDVTATIDPENVRVARRAAEVFALEVAGIDIISADITRPWHENGAIINEVNYAPLLGGHPISRRSIERYLRGLIPGDGRIPVEVFVGGAAALTAARRRHEELTAAGDGAFLVSRELVLDASGEPLPLAVGGEYLRCRALLVDRQVATIVLAVQSDEFEQTGLPVDRITRLEVVDRMLVRHDGTATAANDLDIDSLVARLRSCLAPQDAAPQAGGSGADGSRGRWTE